MFLNLRNYFFLGFFLLHSRTLTLFSFFFLILHETISKDIGKFVRMMLTTLWFVFHIHSLINIQIQHIIFQILGISITWSVNFNRLLLWVIITLVQPFISLNNSATFCSVTTSNDDVGSSNKIIGDFFNKPLISDILCFYPPENMLPFSPTFVLYCFGSSMITSWRPNAFV